MRRLMMCLALLSLSGAALAEFDYSFVQASYGQISFDDLDVDGDALGVGGSFALTDQFHVFGGYETADFDAGIDMNGFQAGMGYNMSLSESVDLVGSLAYVTAEVETPFGSADDNGYGLGLGVRGMASPTIELSGGINYVDLGGASDGETSFDGGFLYHFTDAFAVGLAGSWGDDTSTYALNGRFSFGE